MKIILLILGAVVVASQAATYTMPMLREWATFKVDYDKGYENELEENLRMKIFFDNKRIIDEHNARYEQGLTTFYMGVNQFADMTLDEYAQTMLSFNNTEDADFDQNNVKILPEVSLPKSINWRKRGAVNPIKDQDDCGSCYAFSSLAALESAHFIKTGKLYSLSEKQIVDCSSNSGCNGGVKSKVYKYIKEAGGIESGSDYPYEPSAGACKADKSKFIVQVAGYDTVAKGDEAELKQFVGVRGPTGVTVDASKVSFKQYKGGVHYNEDCNAVQVNHGVTVVGYGSEDGEDYWLVRNSWGADWGEKGYIRMARDMGNNCGIATRGIIPTV